MANVDHAWAATGVDLNVAKSVDGGEKAEFQGAMIESREHWLGASRERRVAVAAALVQVLLLECVHVQVVERAIGQLSH
eukprot:873832-Lingulodinium_polyedra.AAC.1